MRTIDDTMAHASARRMQAKYNYNARLSSNVDSECELSFRAGDMIVVYGEMDDDGFYIGEFDGQRGLVSGNFVEPCKQLQTVVDQSGAVRPTELPAEAMRLLPRRKSTRGKAENRLMISVRKKAGTNRLQTDVREFESSMLVAAEDALLLAAPISVVPVVSRGALSERKSCH